MAIEQDQSQQVFVFNVRLGLFTRWRVCNFWFSYRIHSHLRPLPNWWLANSSYTLLSRYASNQISLVARFCNGNM